MDDAKQVMRDVKARREDRRAQWDEVLAPYTAAVQARASHLAHALGFIEEVRRGQALGRLGQTVLFQGAILADGVQYPMSQDVRATVLRAGSMATSHGWTMTTHTDPREIHVVVSCDAWEFNIMPQVGATASTHLLIGLTNHVYQWGSKGVQDFASLIGNAARRHPAYAAAVAPQIARAAEDARTAHADVAAIRARLEQVHRAVDRLSLGVAGDLHRLERLDISRFGPLAAQRKLLHGTLEKEEATYLSVPAYFDPGPPPATARPTEPPDPVPPVRPAPRAPEMPEIPVVPTVPAAPALRPPDPMTVPVPPRPPAPASGPAGDAALASLERLADLLSRGVLTDEEFQREKARILARAV